MNVYLVKDDNALRIWFGRDIVCEARSAQGALRLCKLLNMGLMLEREQRPKQPKIHRLSKGGVILPEIIKGEVSEFLQLVKARDSK
jgi:hypothetical protein